MAFQYESRLCDNNTIRLVALEPSSDPSAVLQCTLAPFRLSDPPVYEALSYTWGDAQFRFSISINWCVVDITRNLYDCLRQLRQPHHTRNLWIDALCINQADDEEKSHQIQLMPHIYGKAACVIAWLGEAANGSDDVIAFVKQHYQQFCDNERELSRHLNRPGGYRRLAELQRKISDFLDRPYWNRTWIIQELLKARRQVIVCGESQVDGNQLEMLSELHSTLGFSGWASLRLLSSTQAQITAGGGLINSIKLSQDTECTDTRDKIYALLGLLDETERARTLKVDYSLSVSQLFFMVLRYLENPVDGRARMGVRTVLQTLNLPLSTVVGEDSGIDLGFAKLCVQKLHGHTEEAPDIHASNGLSGAVWTKSSQSLARAYWFCLRTMPAFCFGFRQEKGKWIYSGCTWLVPQDGTDKLLSLAREFSIFFRNYRLGSRITIEKEVVNSDGTLTYHVRLPKLLSAAIEIYVELFQQWETDIERQRVTRGEGQANNGAAAPRTALPDERRGWVDQAGVVST